MGDTKWTYKDGTEVTQHEDGSVTVKDPDGTETHIDKDTGTRTTTPKGGQPKKDDPFNTKTKDGDKTHSFNDGTRYTFKKGPPPKFQRTKSFGKPRTIEIDLSNGGRRTVEEKDDPEKFDKPDKEEKIEKSTHPKKDSEKGGGSEKEKPKKKASPRRRKSRRAARRRKA